MEHFTRSVPTNRMCFWYKGGKIDAVPCVSLVTADEGQGMLGLSIFGPQWARHQCLNGVRHRDDPFLKERPDRAKENGCWDYMPGYAPTADEIPTAPVVEQKPDVTPSIELRDEQKEFVILRASEGLSSTEIAAELTESTGVSWNYQRVNAILRNASKD